MAAFKPGNVLRALLACVAVLVGLHVAFATHRFGLQLDFFRLNAEMNLPTWFSAAQLLLVGILALPIAHIEPVALRRSLAPRGFWYVFAIFFAYLSLDEAAQIHELVPRQGRTPVWIIVFAPVAGLFAAYALWGILRRKDVSPRLPLLVALSFGVMAFGGFVVEWIGFHLSGLAKGINIIVEETCEMAGVSLLVYALLDYRRTLDRLRPSPTPGSGQALRRRRISISGAHRGAHRP